MDGRVRPHAADRLGAQGPRSLGQFLVDGAGRRRRQRRPGDRPHQQGWHHRGRARRLRARFAGQRQPGARRRLHEAKRFQRRPADPHRRTDRQADQGGARMRTRMLLLSAILAGFALSAAAADAPKAEADKKDTLKSKKPAEKMQAKKDTAKPADKPKATDAVKASAPVKVVKEAPKAAPASKPMLPTGPV